MYSFCVLERVVEGKAAAAAAGTDFMTSVSFFIFCFSFLLSLFFSFRQYVPEVSKRSVPVWGTETATGEHSPSWAPLQGSGARPGRWKTLISQSDLVFAADLSKNKQTNVETARARFCDTHESLVLSGRKSSLRRDLQTHSHAFLSYSRVASAPVAVKLNTSHLTLFSVWSRHASFYHSEWVNAKYWN